MQILLASDSPRRSELLSEAGLPFRRVRPGRERAGGGLAPAASALAFAGAKARGADLAGGTGLLLAADTVVAIEEELLGKPPDREDARRCLMLLRGRRHEVWTAVVTCPVLEGRLEEGGFEEVAVRSVVEMRSVSTEDVERYLDSGEWRGKAGGYGIQGAAAGFMQVVEGPLDNVIGLPVAVVRAAFDRHAETR